MDNMREDAIFSGGEEHASIKPAAIFLGNPGCGKSTLLNCIAGHARFGAGSGTDGTGRTKEQSALETEDYILVDTPGLTDIELADEAANQVTQALKMYSMLKLVFVCAVENNSVRTDDINTFQRVLSSISQIDYHNKILIVLNKLSKKWYREYTQDMEKKLKIARSILGPSVQAGNTLILERFEDLEDQENAIIEIPKLKQALDDTPVIDVNPRVIVDIESADRSKEIARLQNELARNFSIWESLKKEDEEEREEESIEEFADESAKDLPIIIPGRREGWKKNVMSPKIIRAIAVGLVVSVGGCLALAFFLKTSDASK